MRLIKEKIMELNHYIWGPAPKPPGFIAFEMEHDRSIMKDGIL